jgi:hypothetical protein
MELTHDELAALDTRLGVTVYDGPSQIDGQPIIAVITLKSRNPKTGAMAQLWILRKDITPSQAIRQGKDRSICGSCPLSGNGTAPRVCYVNLMGPEGVFSRFHKGRYPVVTADRLARLLTGRKLRHGAYGDPAALPFDVIANLSALVDGWTGYTHQFDTADSRFSAYLMASADNDARRALAHSLGYRTFTVRPLGSVPAQGEIFCPATPEGGHRTKCITCGLCNGKTGTADRRKDIAILAHGAAKKRFRTIALQVVA